MPTITVEPKLYKQLEAEAAAQQSDLQAITHQAFRLYLWEQKRRAISQESKQYRQQHKHLKERYLGKFIAMYQGQIVDKDDDFHMLYQRIKKQYGQAPVMITEVAETADPGLHRRGFRFAP